MSFFGEDVGGASLKKVQDEENLDTNNLENDHSWEKLLVLIKFWLNIAEVVFFHSI